MKLTKLSWLLVPLVFSGCNIGCLVEKRITENLAGTLAATLQCSNVDAIQADIMKIVNVVKFCSVEDEVHDLKQGAIANVVCPIAASTAVAIMGNAIPSDWGCSLVNASTSLTVAITQACQTLPF